MADYDNELMQKFKIASRAQRDEIIRHRERLARHLGRPVNLDEAARDWILSYAAEWRARFEADGTIQPLDAVHAERASGPTTASR